MRIQLQKSMIKYLSLADCISLINACFGFLAIIILFSDFEFDLVRFSFSLILFALLADGLDGIIARKTRTSELGDYLEAMADMISMGIAPAVFVFILYFDKFSLGFFYQIVLVLLLLFFVICNMVRLSSFHVMKNKSFFIGLPASACTIFLVTAAYLEINILYILILILTLSLSTISNIRFLKPSIKINVVAMVLIILSIILGKSYNNIAPFLLIFALAIYVLVGPFFAKKNHTKDF